MVRGAETLKTYGICESLTRQGRKVPRHVIQVVAKVDGDVASWASVLLLQQSPWSATYLHFAHFLPDRRRPCRRQCSSSICRRLCQRPASAGRPGLLWHQDMSGVRSGANSSTQSTMLPTFRSLFASPSGVLGVPASPSFPLTDVEASFFARRQEELNVVSLFEMLALFSLAPE